LSTSTTYFTGNSSKSQADIWSWPASGSATQHLINHSTVPSYNGAINGTDGKNWYSRWGIFPGSVESATVSGNTLYLAQGTGRDYCTKPGATPGACLTLKQQFKEPAVFISMYNATSLARIGERWIWNAKAAFTWPALQTDANGDVGIVYRVSHENQNPRPAVMFLTPGKLHNDYYDAEPAGLPQLTGDYYSLRPGPTSRSFVMTAQTVKPGPSMHWDYIEWGK
jgi:hypothetical protein